MTACLGASLSLACMRAAPAPPAAQPPPGAPATPPQTVKWGYVGKQIVQLPIAVAERTGLLAQEGVALESVQMGSSTVTTAALVASEIDYADGFASAIRDAIHGFPLKAIVTGERYSSYQLLARPEIRAASDLKGGKAGTSRINSGDYYILVDWLRRNGLDPDHDVTMINTGGTDVRYTALVSGAIDVTLLAAPASLVAIKDGARVLGNPEALAPYPLGGLSTTENQLAAQRGDVKKMVRAYVRALQAIEQDEAMTVGVLRNWLDVDDEIARGSYRFVRETLSPNGMAPEAGIQLILDTERAANGIAQDLPLSTGVDFSVLEEVRQELQRAGPAGRAP